MDTTGELGFVSDLKIRILLRDVAKSACPRVKIVGEGVLGNWDPFFFLEGELFSLRVKSTDCICVVVNETDFVTQIPALIHHGERLPHACSDVDLLHVRGEAGAEASAEDDDFVRFRAKACTVGQRQLKFDFKEEPVAVLDAVPLNQSILYLKFIIIPKAKLDKINFY